MIMLTSVSLIIQSSLKRRLVY